MMRHYETRSPRAFDRPLRRLTWVVPVSLCLWTLVLAGFSILLGRVSLPPTIQPLEVSLADLSHGMAGGSPGGGAGPEGGSGASGVKATGHSPLPIANAAVTAGPSGQPIKHPLQVVERQTSPVALKTRIKSITKK